MLQPAPARAVGLEAPYQHAEKEMAIHLRDGTVRDMSVVLRAVLDMWIAEFKSRGLLSRLEPRQPAED